MSTARKTEPVPDLAERFREAKPAFEAKYAAVKAEEEALKKRSLACFVYEDLMRSVGGGRARQPERSSTDPCEHCRGETVAVGRTEDTSVMFGGLSYDHVVYIVCFACCSARRAHGSRSDRDGIHYA